MLHARRGDARRAAFALMIGIGAMAAATGWMLTGADTSDLALAWPERPRPGEALEMRPAGWGPAALPPAAYPGILAVLEERAEKVRPSACPASLAYLDRALPDFPMPELADLRRRILATDLREARAAAARAGVPARAAAILTLRQAMLHDGDREQSLACVRHSAVDLEAVRRSLRDGRFDAFDGKSRSCAGAVVAFLYEAVAGHETALGLACPGSS